MVCRQHRSDGLKRGNSSSSNLRRQFVDRKGRQRDRSDFSQEREWRGRQASQHRDTNSSFYPFDALGSTRVLTDASICDLLSAAECGIHRQPISESAPGPREAAELPRLRRTGRRFGDDRPSLRPGGPAGCAAVEWDRSSLAWSKTCQQIADGGRYEWRRGCLSSPHAAGTASQTLCDRMCIPAESSSASRGSSST